MLAGKVRHGLLLLEHGFLLRARHFYVVARVLLTKVELAVAVIVVDQGLVHQVLRRVAKYDVVVVPEATTRREFAAPFRLLWHLDHYLALPGLNRNVDRCAVLRLGKLGD